MAIEDSGIPTYEQEPPKPSSIEPVCPKCTAPLADEDRFCAECGFDKREAVIAETPVVLPVAEVLPEPEPEQPKETCPKCTAPLAADDRFCAECGFDKQAAWEMEVPTEIAPVIIPEAVIEPEPEPEQPKETCPKCTAPLAAEDRFCAECGFDKQATVIAETPVVLPIAEVLAEPEPEQPKETCPKCTAPLAADDRFCAECGFDKQAAVETEFPTEIAPVIIPEAVIEPEPIPEKITVPEPLQETAPEPVIEQSGSNTPTQFCPNCGSKQSLDDVFCQDCGHNMNAEIASVTTPEPKTEASIAEPVIAPVPSLQKPSKKEKVIAKPAPQANAAAVDPAKKKKSNKLILVVLLGLLALGVLGAGGWFAYNTFFANEKTESAETTVAQNEVTPPVQVPESNISEEQLPEEVTAVEAELPKEPEKKQTQPKKKTPKKTTEPQKQQVVPEEPVKKNDQVTVVLKNTTTEKSSVTLFSSFNTKEVKGGPVFAQKVKFSKPTFVTRITTFHHNDGNGAVAGTITLEGKKKETGGPWQARNAYGSDGTVNGKWICEPNARMEPGTYKVVVSDEKSWSYNAESGRKGFVIVEGYEAD
jgi:predicted amidophosphoribosyltransferase